MAHTTRHTRRRMWGAAGLAFALFVASCSSGDDTTDTTDTSDSTDTRPGDTVVTEPTDTTAVTTPELTGPAPGVTDDTITIGVNYVDTEALLAVGLNYDLGDHLAVYQALIDDINASGGINGRSIEAVFAPIDPTNSDAADQSCLELTEDVDAFVVTGFFLEDAVLCPVDLHATAVVGGSMTPTRLQQAKAPWITWTPDTDQPETIIRTLAERGELDGSVAVYAAEADRDELESLVLPTLADVGIEPVETALMDAPTDDTTALQSSIQLIAEKFAAQSADTVLLVGISAATWPQYLSDDASYRPKLLFLDSKAPAAFATSGDTTDTTILEGSLTGGSYGPNQALFEEAAMQECVAVLADAGIDTPEPAAFDGADSSNQPYQAAFQACPDMALIRAALEAAGDNLNYGTLGAAIDGLVVHVPGDPDPRTYGPGLAGDGDPAAYLFGWDESTKSFVLDTEG